mgnify:CR=1 FL=1
MNNTLVVYRVLQLFVPLCIYFLIMRTLPPLLYGELLIPLSLASFLGNVFNQNLDNYFSATLFGKRLKRRHTLIFSIIFGYKAVSFFLLFLIWSIAAYINSSWIWFFAIYTAMSTIFIPHFYIAVLNRYELLLTGFIAEKLLIITFIVFFLDTQNYHLLNMVFCFGVLTNIALTLACLKLSLGVRINPKDMDASVLVRKYKRYLKDAKFFIVGKATQVHTDFFKFLIGVIFGNAAVVVVDFLEKVVNTQRAVFSVVNNHFQYVKMSYEFTKKMLCYLLALSSMLIALNVVFLPIIAPILNAALSVSYYQAMAYSLILFATPVITVVGQNYSLRTLSKIFVAKSQIQANLIILVILSSLYFFAASQELYLLVPFVAESILALFIYRNFSRYG